LLPYTMFCPLFRAFCCAVVLVLNLLLQIPLSRLFPSGFTFLRAAPTPNKVSSERDCSRGHVHPLLGLCRGPKNPNSFKKAKKNPNGQWQPCMKGHNLRNVLANLYKPVLSLLEL
jgi:hypothetical protein